MCGDPPIQIIPKPCSRCGAGNRDEDYSENQRVEAALCAEVQMAFGLVAWLCHQCRSDWHKRVKEHPLQRTYSLLQIRLEFWRSTLSPHSENGKLQEGIDLVNAIEDLELKINEYANEWLING